jgi:hypothetical protein
MRALNVVVVGALGAGATANTLLDAQGKSIAEQIRSRVALIPGHLLDRATSNDVPATTGRALAD